MRIRRPKDKRLERVILPDELVAFLIDVHGMIERREPEAMLSSDDLLQDKGVYGGRIEENGEEWGFTFFPGRDIRPKWDLVFTRAQLKAIAGGELRSVELFTCADPACGCRFASEQGSCFDCDYEDLGG